MNELKIMQNIGDGSTVKACEAHVRPYSGVWQALCLTFVKSG